MLEPHGEPISPSRTGERFQPKIEIFHLNSAPRIYANPPLPDTALVVTTPFSGVEWQTGNVTRILDAFFAQQVKDKPIELEFIGNTRGAIYLGRDNFHATEFRMDLVPEDKREKVTGELMEMRKANDFLKKVVHIQEIGRRLDVSKPYQFILKNQLNQEISTILQSESDSEKRSLLQKSLHKSSTHAFSLVDVTETNLGNTLYDSEIIDTLRTMGVDIACARHANKHTIISLYDADTVPISNGTFSSVIESYRDGKQFLFTELGYRIPGDSLDILSNAPDLNRLLYNQDLVHTGSPQISFTKNAYEEKLKAIVYLGLYAQEDIDTAFRLAYYFEKGSDLGQITPVHLTVMRENGYWDGLRGLEKNSPDEKQPPRRNADVFAFRKKVETALSKLPRHIAEKAQNELLQTRQEYEKESQKISRFNRHMLKTYISAMEAGYITLNGEDLHVESDKIAKRFGGTLLQHYLTYNAETVKAIMSDPDKIKTIQYMLGIQKPPAGWRPITRFDWAIREYFGEYGKREDVVELDEYGKNSFFTFEEKSTTEKYPTSDEQYSLKENESSPALISTHFALNAEAFALSHINRKYILHDVFIERIQNVDTDAGPVARIHGEESRNELYSNFEERMKAVKSFLSAPY
jgi:hypothetical protein